MSTPAPLPAGARQPVNRKMGYIAFGMLAVVGVIALMWAGSKDPVAHQKADAEKAERAAVEAMPEGSEEQGRKAVASAAEDAAKRAAAPSDQAAFQAFTGSERPAGQAGMPPLDPELLRKLDEAQREVGRSPDLATNGAAGLPSGSPASGVGGSTIGDAGGGHDGLTYDHYGPGLGAVKDAVGEQVFGESADNRAADDAQGASGTYEALRPQAQPGANVIAQGTAIQAVLMTRIDTRQTGPVTALVRRTVYDSRTLRVALIPQGSRLVGTYETNVKPGVDRIAVTFQRLILPDGRAFSLPGFPTSGADGTIGVVGKYKSNLLRAIGPAIVVAIAGQAADRQLQKDIPAAGGVTQTPMGSYQAPSVMEQTMPKINEAVMQRYEGARPYFLAEPGQAIRVVVTADMDVPTVKARGVQP